MPHSAGLRPLQLGALGDLEGQRISEQLLAPIAQDHTNRAVLRSGAPGHAIVRRLRLREPAGHALVELLRRRREVAVDPRQDGVTRLAEPAVAGLLRVGLEAPARVPGHAEISLAVGHGPGLHAVHEQAQPRAVVGGGHAMPLAVVHSRGGESVHGQADIRRGSRLPDGIDGPRRKQGLRGAADQPGEEIVVGHRVGAVVGLAGGDTDVLAAGPLGDDVEPAVVLCGAGGEDGVVALRCGLHPHHVGARAGGSGQVVRDRHGVRIRVLAHMQQVRHPSHLRIGNHEHQMQRPVQHSKRGGERHLSTGLHGTGGAHGAPGRQRHATAPSAPAGVGCCEHSTGGHVLAPCASRAPSSGRASGRILHVHQ
mmetsp:Transcript_75652/g.202244  ORF Transcript_75652/g.202244 Transcript_75652/m.202244 type:complete len:367 (+) Transcript_75652:9085-10185(+)